MNLPVASHSATSLLEKYCMQLFSGITLGMVFRTDTSVKSKPRPILFLPFFFRFAGGENGRYFIVSQVRILLSANLPEIAQRVERMTKRLLLIIPLHYILLFVSVLTQNPIGKTRYAAKYHQKKPDL
jgi:hypothetical protein